MAMVTSVTAYIFVQIFQGAIWTVIVAMYGFALFQGSSAFVYLAMNRAIRAELRTLYRRFIKYHRLIQCNLHLVAACTAVSE